MDPYAAFNAVNSTYVHFRRMHQFEPHKLYKFVDIQGTNHASYGPGYMAFLTDHIGVKYKVQLPGKYLRQLTLPDHINCYLKDIERKKNPFLVYRRQLPDNSFVIEIKKFDSHLMQLFIKNLSAPETFLSLEEGVKDANALEGAGSDQLQQKDTIEGNNSEKNSDICNENNKRPFVGSKQNKDTAPVKKPMT